MYFMLDKDMLMTSSLLNINNQGDKWLLFCHCWLASVLLKDSDVGDQHAPVKAPLSTSDPEYVPFGVVRVSRTFILIFKVFIGHLFLLHIVYFSSELF